MIRRRTIDLFFILLRSSSDCQKKSKDIQTDFFFIYINIPDNRVIWNGTISYYTIHHYTIPYFTIPNYTIPCYTIPYYAIPNYTISYYTIIIYSIHYMLYLIILYPIYSISESSYLIKKTIIEWRLTFQHLQNLPTLPCPVQQATPQNVSVSWISPVTWSRQTW